MSANIPSPAVHKLREDPFASLLIALFGYGVGRVLLAGVYPSMRMVAAVWLILAVTLASTIIVAAYRRKAVLLWIVLLEGGGLGGVVVGLGLALYMAVERLSWLKTSTALLCYCYATVGVAMFVGATRIREANDVVVPPNQLLERTRDR